ncbi:MAG: hypothetical protein ACOVR6_04280 [Fimbriimonas sp.]|jgi:hypothetical protein
MLASLLFLQTMASPTLSIKVDGEGYFRFAFGTKVAYARQVRLIVSNGKLSAADGSTLIPAVLVPEQATKLTVSLDGKISGTIFGREKQLGSIVLAMFTGMPSFKPIGLLSLSATKATVAAPGEGLAGVIRPIVKPQNNDSNPVNLQSKPYGFLPNGYNAINKNVAKSEVKVKFTSEVNTEVLTLGDVADISGDSQLVEKLKNVDLGKSPILGTKKNLSTLLVKALISSQGVDMRQVSLTVPTGAVVERKAQRIGPEEIATAVQEAFKKKLNVDTILEPKSKINSMMVPPGTVSFEVSNTQLNPSDISTTVDISVDGKLANSLHLRYDITQLPQIKRGDVVRLRLISNTAKVEVNAKAKGTAFLGQSVTVETDNGTIHTGRLIGPSIVEVNL